MFEWEADGDRFSFEDSDRFEDDSLCSWISEPESLCNNWRGWRKPNCGTGGAAAGTGSAQSVIPSTQASASSRDNRSNGTCILHRVARSAQRKKNGIPLPPLLPFPFHPCPVLSPPFRSRVGLSLRLGVWGALKVPQRQRIQAEPGRKMVFGEFQAKSRTSSIAYLLIYF